MGAKHHLKYVLKERESLLDAVEHILVIFINIVCKIKKKCHQKLNWFKWTPQTVVSIRNSDFLLNQEEKFLKSIIFFLFNLELPSDIVSTHNGRSFFSSFGKFAATILKPYKFLIQFNNTLNLKKLAHLFGVIKADLKFAADLSAASDG